MQPESILYNAKDDYFPLTAHPDVFDSSCIPEQCVKANDFLKSYTFLKISLQLHLMLWNTTNKS